MSWLPWHLVWDLRPCGLHLSLSLWISVSVSVSVSLYLSPSLAESAGALGPSAALLGLLVWCVVWRAWAGACLLEEAVPSGVSCTLSTCCTRGPKRCWGQHAAGAGQTQASRGERPHLPHLTPDPCQPLPSPGPSAGPGSCGTRKVSPEPWPACPH